MTRTIPLVDYLVIEGERPYLRVHECTECRARYFDRRNGCANCGGSAFVDARVSDTGTVRAFTIVSFAAPGVPVPFAPAIVDCDGTTVRANIVNIPLDPQHLRVGMKVRLVLCPVGVDDQGVEAIGFGFEPPNSHSTDDEERPCV